MTACSEVAYKPRKRLEAIIVPFRSHAELSEQCCDSCILIWQPICCREKFEHFRIPLHKRQL